MQTRETFGEILSGNHCFLRPGIPLHILNKLHILMQQKYFFSNTKTAYN